MSTELVLEPRPQSSKSRNEEPSDWVYQEILHAILEQRLAPGTKLGEELLSNIFDVSRPVVRRALNRLTHDNVVEMRPHRGAFIASPTVDQARQVFEARRVVEEAVVRTCVRSATAGVPGIGGVSARPPKRRSASAINASASMSPTAQKKVLLGTNRSTQ